MDDIERRAALDAMLRVMTGPMMRLTTFWDDMGSKLTESQNEEIMKELDRIKRTAGRAAVIAKECVSEARKTMSLSDAHDVALEYGFALVPLEDIEDDDDDGDDSNHSRTEV